MTTFSPPVRSRTAAAVAAIALQLVIGYALVTGLTVRIPAFIANEIKVFDVAVPPPPQPVIKPAPRPHRAKPAGAAAPPHARATPTPVVAPPLEIRLPPPPPLIVTAPLAGIGADAAAGASDRGQGTGAGGQGSGSGSGESGNGTGSGGSPSRWLRGELSGRDYPRAAKVAGIEGNLTTRYVIGTDGRISACSVTVSSGNADLDATTCRLAVQRFRYAPARDARGRAVPDIVTDDHHWVIGPPDPADGPRS